ncbi:MAG: response regulator transcription factor [Opitutaceae bacterium]|nr:response regulator transcription factor [Opitutaceae bacterium]
MNTALVEDHLMFRDVLRAVCAQELGHRIVGEADDGLRAVDMLLAAKPDLLLLDLRLPSLDGLDVLARVRPALPKLRTIVLSSRCDRFTLLSVERAQVQGFVDKNTNTFATLKEAVMAVRSGRTWFSAEYQRERAARLADSESFEKILRDRECEALAIIGAPHTIPEAARRLGISAAGVEKQRARLLQKLGLETTAELVRYAQENGFTRSSSSGDGGRLQP